MNKNQLEERLRSLKAELSSSHLVAVTKYSPIDDVVMAYECGQVDFGENRVQDLKEKADFFVDQKLSDVRWHFIGNLQSNKVRDLLKIPNLHAIHSVSSLKLVEELLKREGEFTGDELKVFFQLNTGHEEEKSGFDTPEEMISAIEFFLSHKSKKLKLHGLMTMGSIRTDDFEGAAKYCFSSLVAAKKEVESRFNVKDLKLSMGMSQDYKIALSMGADYVRVGSMIFK